MNGYQCNCGIGYKGKHCEIDIDLCTEPGLCVNSVSCSDKGSRVECVCRSGYTGTNCAVNIDECASKPCKNGGTCHDKINGFECQCTPSFSGKTCEGLFLTMCQLIHFAPLPKYGRAFYSLFKSMWRGAEGGGIGRYKVFTPLTNSSWSLG